MITDTSDTSIIKSYTLSTQLNALENKLGSISMNDIEYSNASCSLLHSSIQKQGYYDGLNIKKKSFMKLKNKYKKKSRSFVKLESLEEEESSSSDDRSGESQRQIDDIDKVKSNSIEYATSHLGQDISVRDEQIPFHLSSPLNVFGHHVPNEGNFKKAKVPPLNNNNHMVEKENDKTKRKPTLITQDESYNSSYNRVEKMKENQYCSPRSIVDIHMSACHSGSIPRIHTKYFGFDELQNNDALKNERLRVNKQKAEIFDTCYDDFLCDSNVIPSYSKKSILRIPYLTSNESNKRSLHEKKKEMEPFYELLRPNRHTIKNTEEEEKLKLNSLSDEKDFLKDGFVAKKIRASNKTQENGKGRENTNQQVRRDVKTQYKLKKIDAITRHTKINTDEFTPFQYSNVNSSHLYCSTKKSSNVPYPSKEEKLFMIMETDNSSEQDGDDQMTSTKSFSELLISDEQTVKTTAEEKKSKLDLFPDRVEPPEDGSVVSDFRGNNKVVKCKSCQEYNHGGNLVNPSSYVSNFQHSNVSPSHLHCSTKKSLNVPYPSKEEKLFILTETDKLNNEDFPEQDGDDQMTSTNIFSELLGCNQQTIKTTAEEKPLKLGLFSDSVELPKDREMVVEDIIAPNDLEIDEDCYANACPDLCSAKINPMIYSIGRQVRLINEFVDQQGRSIDALTKYSSHLSKPSSQSIMMKGSFENFFLAENSILEENYDLYAPIILSNQRPCSQEPKVQNNCSEMHKSTYSITKYRRSKSLIDESLTCELDQIMESIKNRHENKLEVAEV